MPVCRVWIEGIHVIYPVGAGKHPVQQGLVVRRVDLRLAAILHDRARQTESLQPHPGFAALTGRETQGVLHRST
jgi:hypothetical protein